MFSRILHRPALAIVVSLLILFMGGLSITMLPTSQFPTVAPPSVVVAVSFPGASAKVWLTRFFDHLGTIHQRCPRYALYDLRCHQRGRSDHSSHLRTRNRPQCGSDECQQSRASGQEQSAAHCRPRRHHRDAERLQYADYVNVYSNDTQVDQNFLYNYANVNILPENKRIQGVGRANILGNRAYAMRVELNLDRLRAYNLSAEDVMKAIADQSMIGSPGRLGQATGRTSQTIEYVLTWIGRYDKPEQYENIILRANSSGEIIRIRDVATVDLGSSFYDLYSYIDGRASAAIVLKQTPGSNASVVIENVKEKTA